MSKKNKKILKTNIISFIVGTIISGCIGVYAITYFPSNDVTYDNSISGLQSTNVQGAIDELYKECTTEKVDVGGIDVPIVDTGDGLYKDEYEDRYFYKGANPNNYITFNDETAGWRIISVEADGSIKIMRDEDIGEIAWDTSGTTSWGNSGSNDWARPADLNEYLNDTYFNSLSQAAQSQIVSHDWSIGAVTVDNTDMQNQVNDENSNKWNGKIALPTLSEYIRTNTNTSECGTLNGFSGLICQNSTWMFYSCYWWTLSPVNSVDYPFGVFGVSVMGNPKTEFANDTGDYMDYTVRPALYLNSNLTLSGSGTQSDPYTIEM